jgi:hypothetical protein
VILDNEMPFPEMKFTTLG